MPRIVYVFRGGRHALLKRVAEGMAPREFLYGYDAFVEAGWDTSVAEPAPGDSRWVRPLMRPLERAVGAFFATGFAASTPVVHWDKIRRADVVVSTANGTMFPLLVLRRMGVLRGKVLAFTPGIHESTRELETRAGGAWRVRVLASLLRDASQLVVLGVGDADGLRSHAGCQGLPVEIVPFGTDESFWTPADVPSSGRILSVGADYLRDFPTLLRAAGELPVHIVTTLEVPAALRTPHTTVDGYTEEPVLRSLYRSSRFVVVPIRNERRSSGHAVTLQAMACAKAVILSDTPGLWDRELMVDGETCRLVPPEDPEALRRVMRELWDDPAQAERLGRAARRLVEARWTSRQFGQRLVRLATSLL